MVVTAAANLAMESLKAASAKEAAAMSVVETAEQTKSAVLMAAARAEQVTHTRRVPAAQYICRAGTRRRLSRHAIGGLVYQSAVVCGIFHLLQYKILLTPLQCEAHCRRPNQRSST
eukprot:scaffold193805_cov30-Tisochrysis_lutea.AAC.1